MRRNNMNRSMGQSIRPDKYHVERDLGEHMGGMNAGILIVRDRSGRRLVEKKMSAELIQEGLMQEEAQRLMQMRHKNICELHDVFIHPSLMGGSIWLEYCDAGDFHDMIGRHMQAVKPIGERFIWKVFYQIASALKYCHGGPGDGRNWRWNTTVHRDLKPDNVLLKFEGHPTPEAKLADFGAAADATTGFQSPTMTPFEFAPPEMEYGVSSPESDVYQLGGVMYCAITLGSSPYRAMCDWENMGYTESLLSAIYCCTQTNPRERPNSLDLPDSIKMLAERVMPNLPRNNGLLTFGPGQEQGRGRLHGLGRMYGRI